MRKVEKSSQTILRQIRELINKRQFVLVPATVEGRISEVQENILKNVDALIKSVSRPEGALVDCQKLMDKYHQEIEEYGNNEVARRTIIGNIFDMLKLIVFKNRTFSGVYFPSVRRV